MAISELIASTAYNRRTEIADAVTANNTVFYMLNKKKRITEGDFSGSSLLEPITYSGLNKTDDGTLHDAGFFNGYAAFDPTLGAETLTASEWTAKELGAVINTSNRESWQNAGEERVIDIVESKVENMKLELQELVSTSTWSDGTAFGGDEFDSIPTIISPTPAVGITGGLNRASDLGGGWRNQYLDGGAVDSTTIVGLMDEMDLLTRRGAESVDMIVCGKTMFRAYQDSLHNQRRITTAELGDSGFKTLEYTGIPVMYDAKCDDDDMYFINTKTFKFRYPKGWWFKVEKGQQVPGATYKYVPCYVAGNFTCSDLARIGLIQKTL